MSFLPKSLCVVAVFICVRLGVAEDIELRQQAVQLLEHADAVSTPAVQPPAEAFASFRWFNSDGSSQEGTLTVTMSPGVGTRGEWHFGDFHLVNVHTDRKIAISGENAAAIPAAVKKVGDLLPIRLLRFDHTDTIRSVTDREVRGRAARCIEFDTVSANDISANEICVDKRLGTLVRFQDGAEVTENSDWFQFAGAYLPGRIDVSRRGVQIVEIHTSRHAIEGKVDANVFLPPPGAEIKTRCRQVRRPFGQSVPQPPAGSHGSDVTDVLLHGTIGADGVARSIVVDESDRPDLDSEAIQTVSRWVFTPAICDGKAITWEANFVVHFQGR